MQGSLQREALDTVVSLALIIQKADKSLRPRATPAVLRKVLHSIKDDIHRLAGITGSKKAALCL